LTAVSCAPDFCEDIVDHAIDDVGVDRGVGAAPEHDARGGDDGEVVQHDQGIQWGYCLRMADKGVAM
jgi:hypothetical protein